MHSRYSCTPFISTQKRKFVDRWDYVVFFTDTNLHGINYGHLSFLDFLLMGQLIYGNIDDE